MHNTTPHYIPLNTPSYQYHIYIYINPLFSHNFYARRIFCSFRQSLIASAALPFVSSQINKNFIYRVHISYAVFADVRAEFGQKSRAVHSQCRPAESTSKTAAIANAKTTKERTIQSFAIWRERVISLGNSGFGKVFFFIPPIMSGKYSLCVVRF